MRKSCFFERSGFFLFIGFGTFGKTIQKMKSSKKKFLKLPEFPGGKKAFIAYIKSNLIYPEEALKQRIEGVVYLVAEINDNGDVLNVTIEKGLGAGCDEEAVRLIKNVRFGGVKNRGVRVKAHKKFRIEFNLPRENKINYHLVNKNKTENTSGKSANYVYSISLSNQSNNQ